MSIWCSIFLISIQQTNLHLLHTTITTEYLEYLLSSNDNNQSLPFLTVNKSKGYDLEQIKERQHAAELVIALVKFLSAEQ